MKTSFQKHIDAILSGRVSRSNVIGLRKAINADYRRGNGWSVSRTCSQASSAEVAHAVALLETKRPRITGSLATTGKAVLRNPRYRKRWAPAQAEIVSKLDYFRLAGFYAIENGNVTPVYEAVSQFGRSFRFINVPWQSGGKGPEVI